MQLINTLFALMPLLAGLAGAHPTARQNKVEVVTNCRNSGQIGLTFDDGPNNYEPEISKTLTDAGGKATFFLNGNNWNCIYNRVQTVRDLHAAGHTIGSHTWSHADLTTLDEAGINAELEKLETAFIRILGLKPLYFRPPYGNYNDLVLKVLSDRGYKKLFLWTEDSGDTTGLTVDEQKAVLDSAAASYPAPHIILQHSVKDNTPQVVTYQVPKLQQAGYEMVSLDTCMGDTGEWPYTYVGEPQVQDLSWVC